jgi:hypothetical protein
MAKVWSELPEPNTPKGTGRDCLYCAYAMALIHAGFDGFPLGAYTVAEREALERSDTRPDETGATCADGDRASSKRYGVKLRKLAHSRAWPGGRPRDLAAALAVPGSALLVTGRAGAFPRGLRLYGFTGAHAVTAITLGANRALLLDPLRPNGYPGQIVATSALVAFNAALSGADIRIIGAGELGAVTPGQPEPPAPAPPRTYTVRQGDTLTSIARRHGTTWPILYELNRAKLERRGAGFLLAGWVLVLP